MNLKDIYNSKNPVISFEIFPPKGEGEQLEKRIKALFDEIKVLSTFDPAYISVTYGAGGSTRDRSFDLVFQIQDELNILPIAHFTCVGATKEEILNNIKFIESKGINNILALRGDPPQGEVEFKKPEGGFGYANELVEFIKSKTNHSIAVAGYPEKHSQCTSFDEDIENLKRKVDAGADLIITQVFYENSYFFKFLEKTQKAGINVPIVPGVLPITNVSQIERMMTLCNATIPEKLIKILKQHENEPETVKEIGIEYATLQCKELLDTKVPGLHFCILNKSFATKKILDSLNLAKIKTL